MILCAVTFYTELFLSRDRLFLLLPGESNLLIHSFTLSTPEAPCTLPIYWGTSEFKVNNVRTTFNSEITALSPEWLYVSTKIWYMVYCIRIGFTCHLGSNTRSWEIEFHHSIDLDNITITTLSLYQGHYHRDLQIKLIMVDGAFHMWIIVT